MQKFFFPDRPAAGAACEPPAPVEPPPRYWLERVELDGVPQRVEDFRIETVVDSLWSGPGTRSTVYCWQRHPCGGALAAIVCGVAPGPVALKLRTIFNRQNGGSSTWNG
jgi:hypothetical protein